MFVDYYEILQVHPCCDEDILRRVRKHYALKYHPDKAPACDREEFTRRLQQINNMLDILLDPARRSEYDATHPFFNKYGIHTLAEEKYRGVRRNGGRSGIAEVSSM